MKTSRARTRGFTLIELMVALVAGSFVVAGAYYLSDVSARLFNEQVRRAETQMTLRTAGEQLRRDIGRAGFMAARDTAELWGCTSTQNDGSVSPRPLQAVRLQSDGNGQETLFLTGNFSTSDQYPLNPASVPGRLVLEPLREGFRRSFTNPANNAAYPASFLAPRFHSAFAPNTNDLTIVGRMLAVQDLSNARVYLTDIIGINDAGANGPEISINPPLPVNAQGGCIASFATLVVAPVSTVRYAVENTRLDPAELSQVAGTTALTGGARWALVRREINMATNLPILGTARVVLDFMALPPAVSFNIEGVFDRAMVIGAPPAVPDLNYTATPAALPVQSQLRSLVVELIAGSAENTVAALPVGAEGSRIQAARRLTRMEVFMPNMARNTGVR
jgi:prepilin-type N-terminal cleavage/methylation domain-containing protein